MDDDFPARLLEQTRSEVKKAIVGPDRLAERLRIALLPAGTARPKACDAGARAG